MFSQQHKAGRTGQLWHRAVYGLWKGHWCTARPQMTKLGCVGVRIRNVQLGFTGTVGNQSRTAGWTERLIGKISHSNE